ncbi:HNH endonuclease signature motif containing protein [Microbacterium halotolerans]|uniref:HNH endonuclease signature motif containing protein n=1 Tax=Microbacterium halotolerans TaxID=246613 RepID=UPI0013C2BFA8|nr:HNH endonuclease signature motif containing protein [Microbacterium halotolerans]
MSMKQPPIWFPTVEEQERSRALLGEIEAAERAVRVAEAARARASAELMRIAVVQGRRALRTRGTRPPVPVSSGPVDDMPARSVAAEVALVRGVTRFRAKADLSSAYLLHESFPATLARVEDATIGQDRARAIVDAGTRLRGEVRDVYEERVLELQDACPTRSVPGFAADCVRVAEQLDPRCPDERARAERRRRVVFTTALSEHLAELHVIGDATAVRGMEDRVASIARTVMRDNDRQHADAATAAGETDPGVEQDPRTFGEICADVAADLILTGAPTAHHVADASGKNILDEIRATVQVTIPVQALTDLNDEPGHLSGHGPLPADILCALADTAPVWERVFRHPHTGALLAADSYKPTAEQRRFLQARDEHCRFPGCDRPFRRCDIDHTTDWARGGETTVTNLGALCRHHHTLRHHSPWKAKQTAAGVYEWTSPTGRAYRDKPEPSVRFVDSEELANGTPMPDTHDRRERNPAPAPF